jgi:hypothetical protein
MEAYLLYLLDISGESRTPAIGRNAVEWDWLDEQKWEGWGDADAESIRVRAGSVSDGFLEENRRLPVLSTLNK